MRRAPRRWLGLGIATSFGAAAVVFACGSDDTSRRISSDGPSEIIVSDVVVYLGSPAVVDAAQTRGEGYSWNLTSAPSGSTLTTSSLAGATSARASFTPDVAGEFVLELAATVRGARMTKTSRVTAEAAPLFFMQTNVTDGGRYVEYRATGSDRSNNRPIACPIPQGGAKSDSDFVHDAFALADLALDWWEAPAGRASRVAFARVETAADGGTSSQLALGSSDSSCATPPVLIGHLEENGPPGAVILQPRYSPDGERVAFIDELESGFVVETAGYDGAARRKLGRFCPDGVDACAGFSKIPARPQWLDAHTVGWARVREDDAGRSWEVVLANDTDNADLRVHMFCPGVVPRTIAFLRDGSVIANPLATTTANLAIYRPSRPGGICQLARTLTTLPSSGSYARDFALSPDESEVAFVRRGTLAGEPEPDGGEPTYGGILYTVPTNGGEASPLGGAEQYALFGPRYVASASQIAWNGATAPEPGVNSALDAGVPALKACGRGKVDVRTVATSDPSNGTYVLGGGNGGSVEAGCSMARGRSSSASLASLPFAAALVTRRIRRRRR